MESTRVIITESEMLERALAASTMLTMSEFVQVTGFDISPFMMDKFWHTLRNKQPIYVDDELIKWMGYDAANLKDRKHAFKKLLATVCPDISTLELSNDQYAKFLSGSRGLIGHPEIYPPVDRSNGKGTTKHLLLEPKLLKKTMMKCSTKRANQVRDYYLALEDLFLLYGSYQTEFRIREAKASNNETLTLIAAKNAEIAAQAAALATQAAELEKAKAAAQIDQQNILTLTTNYLHEAGGYIYIGSTFAQHKNHYYKVGKTVAINKRVMQLNTNCLVDEGFVIIREFEVPAVAELETRIHRALKKFRHSKYREYFQCPYDHLVALIELIAKNYEQEWDALKKIIDSLFITRTAQTATVDPIDPDIWQNPKITKCRTPLLVGSEKCLQIANEVHAAVNEKTADELPNPQIPAPQPAEVPPPPWAAEIRVAGFDQLTGVDLFQFIRHTAKDMRLTKNSVVSVTTMHEALRSQIIPRKDYVNGKWAPVIKKVLARYGITITGVRS